MSTRNLYQVLGLAPGVDQEKIKVAFWSLAKRSHPDVNTDSLGAEERFKEFNGAYEVLRNPARRATYDLVLRHQRSRRRRRFWQATATMLASFTVTIGAGSAAFVWLKVPPVPRTEMRAPVPESNGEVASLLPDFPQPDGDGPAFGYQANSLEMPARADRPDSAIRRATTASADSQGAVAPAYMEIPPGLGREWDIAPSVQVSPAKPPKVETSPAIAQSAPASKPAPWATYRNTRFGFTLKYPDDVFASGATPTDDTANMWVSRDGRSVLHVTATLNAAGTKASQLRRLVMQQRYGNATLDYAGG